MRRFGVEVAARHPSYSDLLEQRPEAIERVRASTEVYLPFVVVAELRDGFRKGSRREENEARPERFLKTAGGILYADAETVEHWVAIAHALQLRGRPIPVHDMWIAALALQHDLALIRGMRTSSTCRSCGGPDDGLGPAIIRDHG